MNFYSDSPNFERTRNCFLIYSLQSEDFFIFHVTIPICKVKIISANRSYRYLLLEKLKILRAKLF